MDNIKTFEEFHKVEEALSFEYEGIGVVNPFTDVTNREDVNPESYYGADYTKSKLGKFIKEMDEMVNAYQEWKDNKPLDKDDDMLMSIDELLSKRLKSLVKQVK